jgi:hypothetical protein
MVHGDSKYLTSLKSRSFQVRRQFAKLIMCAKGGGLRWQFR